MLTLDLTNAPRWHDLGPGVRVQLRPLTTALMVATRGDPVVEALPEDASDEERAAVRTVGDFLARIAAAGGAGAAGAGAARDDGLGRYSWAARLAGPVDPPLEARFNLARGAAKRRSGSR